ncbi:MAG: transmembrane protein [uncultured bacterium]|nr:MAG: transmembrane protein [uncultured bacterium]
MKYQRGVALSGLIFWGVLFFLVAVLGMKVVPTALEYYKIVKDTKAVAAQAAPDATVADIRNAFNKYADIDYLEFKGDQLDISKENGKIVIEFAYEKRIPLFLNVSLLIDYRGSTAGQ